mmetsp:Transcript_46774/g.117873  ORF Transcript_46774/g.117873 Transcript_46774/m.117873 type:complete len:243 (+) Transcript_46774:82-810(+)
MSDDESHSEEVAETTAPIIETPGVSGGEIISRATKSAAYQKVSDILHWRDVIESGLVFLIANMFFYLITVGGYTVVTLISYQLLSYMFCCAVYVGAFKAKNRKAETPVGNPLADRFKGHRFEIDKAAVDEYVNLGIDALNVFIVHLKSAVLCYNIVDTIKYIVILWFVSVIGGWFSGVFFAWLFVLVSFVWPRLYEEKQQQIDAAVAQAKTQAEFHVGETIKKLPPNLKAHVDKVYPIGKAE